jgi:hypothetical protein
MLSKSKLGCIAQYRFRFTSNFPFSSGGPCQRHRTPPVRQHFFNRASIGTLQGGGSQKRKFCVPRGGQRGPDSESERGELSKSGLGFKFGPQIFDLVHPPSVYKKRVDKK